MSTPNPPATTKPFPWQEGHACREDRAMGFELELIELVHRREIAVERGEAVDALDQQIDEIMGDLAAESGSTAA
ncbi:hypothetical protein ACE2AJ_14790 [Aquihabitans daechungensis]|uniref:hypothetical protein n=1 Tax=Aquihabitans daechungensis TaxID=1052257 RepID=UPI003BA33D81